MFYFVLIVSTVLIGLNISFSKYLKEARKSRDDFKVNLWSSEIRKNNTAIVVGWVGYIFYLIVTS